MTFEELLSIPMASSPISWRGRYKSYFESIELEGHKYLELVKRVEEFDFGEDKLLGKMNKENLILAVNSFYTTIAKTLGSYLVEGSPHKAYSIFHDSFGIHNGKISTPRQPSFFLDYRDLWPVAYRLRYIKDPNIGDMFHVPFDLRHKIHSYRYSIPGYPTLYLSSCVYLAFQELNCSDYDNLYAVKVEHRSTNERETLLDMRNNPLFEQELYQYKYLARWPLIMSCCMKVGYPEDPFKPEYIIPQITFQWVKNNIYAGGRNILGVCYPSSKITQKNGGFRGQFYNVAIPTQNSRSEGYCEVLSSKFSLTKPFLFSHAASKGVIASRHSEAITINLNGTVVDYEKTDFGRVEEMLETIPCSRLYKVDGTEL